jgi:P-type E1-E2 ATPase
LIQVVIPGLCVYRLEYLVLDLNGTITIDGSLIEGVNKRLEKLSDVHEVVLVTADTRGTAQQLTDVLHIRLHKVEPGSESEQKARLVRQLGSQVTVSISNGANDAAMLKESTLSICVMGAEGAAVEALASSNLMIPDINIALDLLIKPERFIAILRK